MWGNGGERIFKNDLINWKISKIFPKRIFNFFLYFLSVFKTDKKQTQIYFEKNINAIFSKRKIMIIIIITIAFVFINFPRGEEGKEGREGWEIIFFNIWNFEKK